MTESAPMMLLRYKIEALLRGKLLLALKEWNEQPKKLEWVKIDWTR